jgi:uncharacterized protein Veg
MKETIETKEGKIETLKKEIGRKNGRIKSSWK